MIQARNENNSCYFECELVLAPTLKKGDILALDSCSAHKKHELDSVYEQGAEVVFIPRYSPDLNPCEPSWSKAKSTLRKNKARNEQDLELFTGKALQFTKSDLNGWFVNCGVCVNK